MHGSLQFFMSFENGQIVVKTCIESINTLRRQVLNIIKDIMITGRMLIDLLDED